MPGVPPLIHAFSRRLRRGLLGAALTLLAALCCLALPGLATANPQAAFEDGNRLFRDDLYWAALLRYREAADAGMVCGLRGRGSRSECRGVRGGASRVG